MWRSVAEKCVSLLDPISRSIVPMIDGFARRSLLHAGVAQREVRLNGVTINYYYRASPSTAARATTLPLGQEPLPILLVHGIADSALTWALVIGKLARGHDVYAIDLPGYGLSGVPAGHSFATLDEMRDVLESFIREVIGRPALLVGNSMGGWLGVKLAWLAPALLRGMILIDAGGAPGAGRAAWEQFAEAIGVRDIRSTRLVFRQMFGVIPRPLFYLAIPRPLLYLGLRGFQEMFQRRTVRDFVAALSATMQEDAFLQPDDLRRLPVPAALVWGLADRFLPSGSLEFFQENLAGAPVLLLQHCGHLPQRERPDALVRFVRKFAAQLARERLVATK